MILAVKQIHSLGLIHGDIKLSNFVHNYLGEVFLTDFAPFKPGFFTENNRPFLSYFFNTIKCEDRVRADCSKFVMCPASTDVYELGLSILELYGGSLAIEQLSSQEK